MSETAKEKVLAPSKKFQIQLEERERQLIDAITQLSERTAEVERLNEAIERGTSSANKYMEERDNSLAIIAMQKVEIEWLKRAIKDNDERLLKAAEIISMPYMGCDTAEHLSDEILINRGTITIQKVEIEQLKKDKVIPIPPDKNDDVGFWIEYSQQLRGIAQQALYRKEKAEIELASLKSQESPAYIDDSDNVRSLVNEVFSQNGHFPTLFSNILREWSESKMTRLRDMLIERTPKQEYPADAWRRGFESGKISMSDEVLEYIPPTSPEKP